jgi:hypothetical protein
LLLDQSFPADPFAHDWAARSGTSTCSFHPRGETAAIRRHLDLGSITPSGVKKGVRWRKGSFPYLLAISAGWTGRSPPGTISAADTATTQDVVQEGAGGCSLWRGNRGSFRCLA